MLPKGKLQSFAYAVVSVLFVSVTAWRCGADIVPARAEDGYGTVIDRDETWKSGEEHPFDRSVLITNGARLTIEPGVRIIFSGDYERDGSQLFEIRDGSVDAVGTESDPVVFTKKDAFTVFTILFTAGAFPDESVFRHVRIEGGGATAQKIQPAFLDRFVKTVHAREYWSVQAAVMFRTGKVTIRDSVFRGSGGADIWIPNPLDYGETDACEPFGSGMSRLVVERSDFKGNPGVPALLSAATDCDLGSTVTLHDDWYGSSLGPRVGESGDSNGKMIIGNVAPDGFSSEEFFGTCRTCASNVLFLPGIKASRLYMKNGSGKEDRLWLPDYFGNDPAELALDGNGDSVNQVYTKDVLDEVGIPVVGPDIYKSFLADLEKKKSDRVIADYVPFAYDWRMDVEDIANGYTAYPDDEYRSLADTVRSLAQTSKTGKVTVVAHSNGGLLAKALLKRLKDDESAGLIDQVVFVGTPQMGAPISILSLLYGYGESIPTLLLQKDARALAENMPGAYGLLPSSEYFDRTDDPLVSFSSEHTRFKAFRDAYGGTIGDRGELAEFLSAAKDGRDKPEADDVESENILRKNLLDKADATSGHLDEWTPPDGVKVIQIAGWGLDTIRGVDYAEKEATKCHSAGLTFIPTCTGIGRYEPVYEPEFTVDGDRVVTAPSALMLSEASNVKKYWVDLWSYGKNHIFGNNHANLLEIRSLRDFVSSIIAHTEDDSALPDYISTSRPSDYDHANPRIRMSLYSPLDISLTDSAGNHTGPKEVTLNGVASTIVEEGIPGSSYYRFGDRKYVSFPVGEPVKVRLDGYDDGSYTLRLEEVVETREGEEMLSHTTFENLPVNAVTTVELSIPKEGLAKLSALRADMNGDEPEGEYAVIPVVDGTATFDASQSGVVPEHRDEEPVASGATTNGGVEKSHSGKTASKKSAPKRPEPKKKYEISGVTVGWKGRLLSAGLPSVSSAQKMNGEAEEEPPAVLGAETQMGDSPASAESDVSRTSSMLRTGIRFLLAGPFLSQDMLSFLWNDGMSDRIRWSWTMILAPFSGME